MNKKIYLSLSCILALSVNAQDLGTIEVIETINNKVVNNVHTQDVKSADLAEVLAKKSPSISMIRRSGIANDIILRGQKRDNIKVTIDGGVIHGACPNRMDPPTSHIITSNVQSVEIEEGPFDVTEFGNLSGSVKITTKKPETGLHGSIETTLGSFGYKRGVINVSGGKETVKVALTYSKEESDQYKDGNGDTLFDQNIKNATSAGDRYQDKYKNMKAYEKQSLMVKTLVNINDNNELEISGTKNESDDVLYPSSGMDAKYDDSKLINLKYTAKNLGSLSKKLEVKMFKSDVDHPMDITLRTKNVTMASGTMMQKKMVGMTNHLTTDAKGLKVMNTFDALDSEFLVGMDSSTRNWDGKYYSDLVSDMGKSIDDADTKNNALFFKNTKKMDNFKFEFGARYDNTKIDTANNADENREYNGLSGNLVVTLAPNKNTQYFVGIGSASRVPDARELYFQKSGNSIGTDTLEKTTNTEIDFGLEHKYKDGKIKAKFFYSKLDNYIYFRDSGTEDKFENIDAKIYGFELDGSYYINDSLTLGAGYAYKVGKKDEVIDGQSDTDLADITPAKTTIALTYDHSDITSFRTEFVNVATWDKYDSDNGEQSIDGYNIVNLKAQTTFTKNFELIVGIDNLFDETYAVSNTYSDLALLSSGTTEKMLLNEPGRYIYANLKFKF
jgi:iron complex outermembrane receptor protein